MVVLQFIRSTSYIFRQLIVAECLHTHNRFNTNYTKTTLLIKHLFININQHCFLTNTKASKTKKKTPEDALKILFNLSNEKTQEIIHDYPDLKTKSFHQIIENYNNLINLYSQEYLLINPFYLQYNSNESLERIEFFKRTNLPKEYEYKFFKTPKRIFSHIKLQWNYSKILYKPDFFHYFKDLLECSLEDSINALLKSKTIWSQSPDKIEKTIKLLLELGITRENLLKDPKAISYSETVILQRLNGLKDLSPKRVKSWLIHCNTKTYLRHVKISQQYKKLLEDGTIEEYIAKVLECSQENVQEIFNKHPYIKTISPMKVQSVVQYLSAKGFTVHDILKSPRVLACKITSLDKKLRVLESLGIQVKSLIKICLSKRDFDHFIEPYQKKSI